MDIKKIADTLLEAEKNSRQIKPITSLHPSITIDESYKIQIINISKKIDNGEKVIGMKIGLTSLGMQNLLGVNEPDYGHLTSSMILQEGEKVSMGKLCQPKVEGELAFCLDKPLKGPNLTIVDVYNATSWIAPAIEIVDSRIEDWNIKLQDTVADNGSSAKVVLGAKMKNISDIDMRLIGMILEKNGEFINSGTGAEVLGNPAASVAWLANKLSEFNIGLEAGHIVLSGAVTAAQEAKTGDSFSVSFQGLGSVGVKFID